MFESLDKRESKQRTEEREEAGGKFWYYGATLIVIGSFATLVYACDQFYQDPSLVFVDSLGRLFFQLTLFGIIPAWIVGRSGGKDAGLLTLAVLFTGFSAYESVRLIRQAGESVPLIRQAGEAKAFLKETQQVMDELTTGQPISGGDSSNPVLQFIRDHGATIQSTFAAMQREIEELRLNSALARETLEDLDKISRALAETRKAPDIYNRYETLIASGINEATARLEKLESERKLSPRFLDNFRESSSQSSQVLSELFNVWRNQASELIAVLDLLERHRGRYTFNGESIVFVDGSSAEAFNAHLATLQHLAEQEQELQQVILTTREKLTRRLDALLQ